jgi:hypothetical protein
MKVRSDRLIECKHIELMLINFLKKVKPIVATAHLRNWKKEGRKQ